MKRLSDTSFLTAQEPICSQQKGKVAEEPKTILCEGRNEAIHFRGYII